MQLKHGDFAVFFDGIVEETVVVDEALDDDKYAVRFLDSDDVFTVEEDQLSQ
jgi:hypothetical protein